MPQLQHTRQSREAIAFLHNREHLLVTLYITSIRQCEDNFFTRLDEDVIQTFATTSVTTIINRFEGVPFTLEHTAEAMNGFFEKGATLQDFKQLFDIVEQNFRAEIIRLLSAQPELAEYIVQKLAYMRQAYGSTVALAMSKFQHNSPKPILK